MLTDPGDIVVDIFAGSNTTGFIAEKENRYWLAFEKNLQYLATSSFRFTEADMNEKSLRELHQGIILGENIKVLPTSQQLALFEGTATYRS